MDIIIILMQLHFWIQLLAEHQRNQDLRQEESQESKAVLPEGQDERTEEMR